MFFGGDSNSWLVVERITVMMLPVVTRHAPLAGAYLGTLAVEWAYPKLHFISVQKINHDFFSCEHAELRSRHETSLRRDPSAACSLLFCYSGYRLVESKRHRTQATQLETVRL